MFATELPARRSLQRQKRWNGTSRRPSSSLASERCARSLRGSVRGSLLSRSGNYGPQAGGNIGVQRREIPIAAWGSSTFMASGRMTRPARRVEPTSEELVGKFGAVQPAATYSMSYAYRQDARPGIQSKTTFDAIIAGERTATTRWNKGDIASMRNRKVGDIIAFIPPIIAPSSPKLPPPPIRSRKSTRHGLKKRAGR